jgi:hypothetical protein
MVVVSNMPTAAARLDITPRANRAAVRQPTVAMAVFSTPSGQTCYIHWHERGTLLFLAL